MAPESPDEWLSSASVGAGGRVTAIVRCTRLATRMYLAAIGGQHPRLPFDEVVGVCATWTTKLVRLRTQKGREKMLVRGHRADICVEIPSGSQSSVRWPMGDGRREMGDGKWEKGNRKWEMGDGMDDEAKRRLAWDPDHVFDSRREWVWDCRVRSTYRAYLSDRVSES